MTFDPNVPNANQSPGLFPAQNNNNYARLKTIINADHVFNDTAAANDGVHRQVTMVTHPIAVPGDLPAGTNGLAYAWVDADGQTQLRFYNGTDDFQLTPLGPTPSKVVGSVALAAGATSGTIYTIPQRSFGSIFVNYKNSILTNLYSYYGFFRSTNAAGLFVIKQGGASGGQATASINGNNLRVVNNSTTPLDVDYFIIVESNP